MSKSLTRCTECHAAVETAHYLAHLRWHRHDYLAGYEFALRNLHDEAVQADLNRLAAGVNDGAGASFPSDGADDAPDESKGAIPSAPASAVLVEMFDHLSSQARLAIEKSGPRFAALFGGLRIEGRDERTR